jgi:hypothetical protein
MRALTKVWRAGVKPDKNSEYVRLSKDLEQELEAAILAQLNAGKSFAHPVETPASAKVAMPEWQAAAAQQMNSTSTTVGYQEYVPV